MNQRNRREFLEASMFAAAAAVGGNSLLRPGQLSAAEDATGNASANETLNVAVIGVNGRGGSHLKAFLKRTDTVVTHICDADLAVANRRADAVAERQSHKPTVVQDIRKLLEEDSIDIVSVATPNHWHSLASIWAMEAGKDVYCEKPVSHNVMEGRAMVDVARATNRICQTGTQCRSNPAMIDAMKFIHDGGIGSVKVARGLCYKRRASIGAAGTFQAPASADFNLWSGPAAIAPITRPRFHYDWHWQTAYGNGDLGNQGIHQMDIARWGLGVDRLSDRVLSYGGRFGYVDAGDTANTQVVVHDYGDKSLVFEVRGLPTDGLRDAKVGVIFEGTQGYVVMPSYSSGAAFDLEGGPIREFSGGSDDLHYANFVEAVRKRDHRHLSADILEGHLSSALCHLGNISYRLGQTQTVAETREQLADLAITDDTKATLERTVAHLKQNEVALNETPMRVGPVLKLDAKRETFVDRPDADQLLTREYRAPFVVHSLAKA